MRQPMAERALMSEGQRVMGRAETMSIEIDVLQRRRFVAHGPNRCSTRSGRRR